MGVFPYRSRAGCVATGNDAFPGENRLEIVGMDKLLPLRVFLLQAVWSDGESYVTIGGQIRQPTDTETAIAMATGVSRGAAHTIPSIFFDLAGNGISPGSNPVTLAGGELVEGEDCYVVKVHSEHLDRTF
jgi:hypothetical protein